ncbi:MAG: S8 family serine peptidase [Alphaproteobacteria bacterium]|nr:S8 family serine peptidase [Alphaproteobacteria bacterium]MCB9931722.1 S8 family serine peptidase [Alphaproteobacteria bacterium]
MTTSNESPMGYNTGNLDEQQIELLKKMDAAAAFAATRAKETVATIEAIKRERNSDPPSPAPDRLSQWGAGRLSQWGAGRLSQRGPDRLSQQGFDRLSQRRSGRFGFFGDPGLEWGGEDAPAFAAVAGALDDNGLLMVVIDADDADALVTVVKDVRKLTKTKLIGRVEIDKLFDLAAREDVRRIEASAIATPSLDKAHLATGVRVAPRNSRNPSLEALTGKGVLVGIVDTGIDGTHADFKRNGASRIVEFWDQTGSPSQEPTDEDGHGTHVAGIAAGGGIADPAYIGVAPDADLAVVKTSFQTADIAAGIAHLFEIAKQRNQPCVVNLSLGGHWGAHDGSSITERVIDELCDEPGRMVVVAAGNEGDRRLHAEARFPELPVAADGSRRWVADFELLPPDLPGQSLSEALLQIYTLKEDELDIVVRTPLGEYLKPPQSNTGHLRGAYYAIDTFRDIDPVSGDDRTAFMIKALPARRLRDGWSVIMTATNGQAKVGVAHAWFVGSGGQFTAAATRSHAVGMPGTAFSAITVASYATRKSWPTDAGEVMFDKVNPKDVSYFSSRGPTRDQDNKPEIAAPGQWVVSALSAQAHMPAQFVLPGGKYTVMQGTSMAAPHVTGALALLLEREPQLTWAEAKRRLIKTASQDEYTHGCWNAAWGYGKLNVEALVKHNP